MKKIITLVLVAAFAAQAHAGTTLWQDMQANLAIRAEEARKNPGAAKTPILAVDTIFREGVAELKQWVTSFQKPAHATNGKLTAHSASSRIAQNPAKQAIMYAQIERWQSDRVAADSEQTKAAKAGYEAMLALDSNAERN